MSRIEKPYLAIDKKEMAFEEDYVILGNSGSGKVTGPITFVGYAIESDDHDYNSFDEDTDLTGRIALVLRYEPLDEHGKSLWSDEGFSRHASLRRKLRKVRDLGAEGILIVNPPNARDGRTGLDSIQRSSQFGSSIGIPIAQIDPDLASDLLLQADEKTRDLMTFRRLADLGTLGTLDLSDDLEVTIGAKVSQGVDRRSVPGRNCGGVLRGRGDVADEWLVIGAHYDHVGIGQLSGAMAGNRGQLHPGADDNASGTAGVLVLAERFVNLYEQAPDDANLRSILFLTFDAEEQGLLGSRHFVDHPTLDLKMITAILNFDMIGRLRSNRLLVLGSQTAEEMEGVVESHVKASNMNVALSPASSGRSDEANFIRKGVPGLHFFTGMTDVYHSPEDTYETVNPAGASKVIRFVEAIAWDLVSRSDSLQYTKPEPQKTTSRGYGKVRLGIRPGMDQDLDTGVYVEGVSLETSASEAGIREGDILLSWDGHELRSVRDLFTKLQKHKPGDVVKIKVKRGTKTRTLDVKLKGNENES